MGFKSFVFVCIFCFGDQLMAQKQKNVSQKFLSYNVNPKKQDLRFFLKDEANQYYKSIANLKNSVESKNRGLVFAMNAGMYKKSYEPVGLFIENYNEISPLDTGNSRGNFYLKPNGVFYLTKDKKAFICTTADFKPNPNIQYATQSGPMLLINGQIHQAFKKGSENVNIRNGVGILPDKTIIFVMAKQEINFYDFAMYFKKLGCQNALYLDGHVSRAYLPSQKWMQLDGDFGALIGVVSKQK